VRVNGEVAEIGRSADPSVDEITVDGRPVRPAASHVYIAMNKPAGYACTRWDPHLPRTVYQLLPRGYEAAFTVGRLDVDTEGLLLLTTDGEWANGISHPRRHVEKTYVADVYGEVTRSAVESLRRGVDLEDGRTLPAAVRVLRERPAERSARLSITITEGRKRQVRRMLDAVGLRVRGLERVRIGPVELGDLPLGAWRELAPDEVEALRRETA